LSEKSKYQSFRTALEEGAPITSKNWDKIKSHLKLRKFAKGEAIIKEGEVENYMSSIEQGCVRHFVRKAGNEINFEFAFENELSFSFASFLSRSASKLSIEALEDVTLVSIHYNSLQELYGYPDGEKIGRLTTEGYYIWRENREIQLLTLTAEELYQDLLSQYPEYINRIPQKYLASYLQVQPESLSRIKKRIYGKK
jgi:CRP-like cAMP-binding protein